MFVKIGSVLSCKRTRRARQRANACIPSTGQTGPNTGIQRTGSWDGSPRFQRLDQRLLESQVRESQKVKIKWKLFMEIVFGKGMFGYQPAGRVLIQRTRKFHWPCINFSFNCVSFQWSAFIPFHFILLWADHLETQKGKGLTVSVNEFLSQRCDQSKDEN